MSASSTTTFLNSSASDDSDLPKAARRESPLEAMRAGLDIQEFLDRGGIGAKRLQGVFGLLAGELHAAVPQRNIFHVRHALALDGVGDDHRRQVGFAGMAQRVQNGGNVVAVDFLNVPTKRAPL